MELLVERQVMGGEARQLVGALDGVRVRPLVAKPAGTDVDVPTCGPTSLEPVARLPRERLSAVNRICPLTAKGGCPVIANSSRVVVD